jgi:hypothetical protein
MLNLSKMKSTQVIFENQINKNRILDNIGGALIFSARFNKNGWGGYVSQALSYKSLVLYKKKRTVSWCQVIYREYYINIMYLIILGIIYYRNVL